MRADDEAHRQLYERWQSGDQDALALILEAELPWILDLVHARLGKGLRRAGDTHDFVQDTLIDVLRSGPSASPPDRRRFHAWIARIVENTLRDAHDHAIAQRRDVRREAASTTRLILHAVARSMTDPMRCAARSETSLQVRLALELLPPCDRRILILRAYEERSFKEIAATLQISVKAAQMRFARALTRLGATVQSL